MKPPGDVARRRDYDVIAVDHSVVRSLVTAHHYARRCANTSTARHALRRRADGAIVGACCWMPPTAAAAQALASRHLGSADHHREVLMLSRLVVVPGVPTNAAGMLLAGSTRAIWRDSRWSLLVTYADTSRGHTGTIYRATGWIEDGARESELWRDAHGAQVSRLATRPRTHVDMAALGAVLSRSVKIRFVKMRDRRHERERQGTLFRA